MKSETRNWLPHLEHAVPRSAYGYKICTYAIALEGWRRGLTLKFRDNRDYSATPVKYILSHKGNKHSFSLSRGDAVTKEAIAICVDKGLTKEILAKAGVPVPEGKNFAAEATEEEMIAYAESIGYPVVLKPADQGGGKGVITNIKTAEAFRTALNKLKEDMKNQELMVEKHADGQDYRLYVIGGQVIAGLKRVKAHVVGDGSHTINELIAAKNKERATSPFIYNRPITADEEVLSTIGEQGFTIDSVPAKGERVLLKETNGIMAGGDPVDATDELTEELKQTAIAAVEAIPGLDQAGVDLIVDEANNIGLVNEVNSKAQIGNHLYPLTGSARDIPKAIIDYYFPETKDVSRKESVYFDYKTIADALKAGYMKELTVTPAPKEDIMVKGYTVFGKVQGVGYNSWIRKRAQGLKLHGFTRDLQDGSLLVVVAGSEANVGEFDTIIRNQSASKAEVKEVADRTWTKPVKVGFELQKSAKKKQKQ